MKKKEKRRVFVATIERHESGRDMPVVIRFLRADSLRQGEGAQAGGGGVR